MNLGRSCHNPPVNCFSGYRSLRPFFISDTRYPFTPGTRTGEPSFPILGVELERERIESARKWPKREARFFGMNSSAGQRVRRAHREAMPKHPRTHCGPIDSCSKNRRAEREDPPQSLHSHDSLFSFSRSSPRMFQGSRIGKHKSEIKSNTSQ